MVVGVHWSQVSSSFLEGDAWRHAAGPGGQGLRGFVLDGVPVPQSVRMLLQAGASGKGIELPTGYEEIDLLLAAV